MTNVQSLKARPVTPRKSEGTQAITRAFQILRFVAEQPEQGVRLRDIAAMIDLPSATIHRILQALRREGALDQNPVTRRYKIGTSYIAMLEEIFKNSFRDRMRHIMQEIAVELKCSVYLSLSKGSQMLCIDRVATEKSVLVIPYDIGETRSLGIGAAGIALLAMESESFVETILHKNKEVYKKYNLNPETVKNMVKNCALNGYSYNPGYFIMGISGLGVAFKDSETQRNVAINVALLNHEVSDLKKRTKIANVIMKYTKLASLK